MSKISFLPQDYTSPRAAGAYMKLQEGENRFRILTAPVIGWEDWTMDKKPVRYRLDAKPAASINPAKPIKHFWAFVVWNHAEEKIQVLQITQATIRATLEALCKDQDWGAPFFYDIKIVKSGEGMNTEYAVTPLPHKKLGDHVKKAFNETPCNLEALFSGEDPFAQWDTYTEGVFDEVKAKVEEDVVPNPYADMLEIFLTCSQELRTTISGFLKQKKLKQDFSDLPEHFVDRIEKAIAKDLAANKELEEAL